MLRARWCAVVLIGLAGLTALLTLGGCQVAGYFASAIPKSVDAQYKGLAGQKVAVMVWADRGLRIDWPNLELDTGNGIQSYLLAKTDEDYSRGRGGCCMDNSVHFLIGRCHISPRCNRVTPRDTTQLSTPAPQFRVGPARGWRLPLMPSGPQRRRRRRTGHRMHERA